MAKKNIEGPVHRLLTDLNKVQCEFCNGSSFQIGDQMDENTDFPVDTKVYLMENSTPTGGRANLQVIPILCNCGKIFGMLAFGYDLISARGAGSITGTHIAAAVANGFAGTNIIVCGGTDDGLSFPVSANSAADPTVFTITGTPNANAVGELMIITSFKIF